jgi:hypothetical protein
MGADKNFPEEIPTKSKNHNQGFPPELAKVTSHSRPTNPRNMSKQVAKRKQNSRSKDLG